MSPSPTSSRIDVPPVKVYVFGGGVAGMTAAHELILRGFEVVLYESERALGPRGVLDAPTVGGMARTQYVAVSLEEQKPSVTKVYYQLAELQPLADVFLKQASVERDKKDLVRRFEPKRTQSLLFRFFKRALAELLVKEEAFENKALKHFLSTLEMHVTVSKFPGLLEKAVPLLQEKRRKTLRALKLERQSLGADFKIEDLIQSGWIASFKDDAGKLFDDSDPDSASFVNDWALRCRKLLRAVPPGKPDKKSIGQRLAHALVQSLLTGLDNIANETKDNPKEFLKINREIWTRLVDFLVEFLQAGKSGLPDENVLQVLPWRVSVPLITVLRRLLTREEDPLNELRKACQGMGPPPGTRTRELSEAMGKLSSVDFWLKFEAGTSKLSLKSRKDLDGVLGKMNELVELKAFATEKDGPPCLQILVQAFDDDSSEEGLASRFVSQLNKNQTVSGWMKAAGAEAEALKTSEGTGPVLARAYGKASDPLSWMMDGAQPEEAVRDWVRVIVRRPLLPGEHGYRFFPSYYRHVFDTMKRIPRQKEDGRPMGGTVLDNLVSLPEIGIFSKNSAPFLMSWNPLQAGDALSRTDYNLRNAANLNLQSQDLLQFSLRILRYMTSCSQRRADEMEEHSWWDYLEGLDKRTGTRLYKYSDAFKELVQSSSRVLAALDGASGDARTCGNTYVQLMTQAMVPTPHDNSTLNGPTSEAWFFHWKTHLEHLGVKFVYGELQTLKFQKLNEKDETEQLVAEVYLPDKQKVVSLPEDKVKDEHGNELMSVYFVVATDLISAAQAAKSLKDKFSNQVKDFAFKTPPRDNAPARIDRDPASKFSRDSRDRLQTIAGIQYFFKRHVNVFDGYIYCVDAEWGLSAICSHLVWQDRPSGRRSTYQSILSVDIGDWNKKSKRLDKEAWQCTPEELQAEVLRQIRVSLSARGADQNPASFVLPDPDWVHIDDYLEYGPVAKKLATRNKLRLNKSPYLVPIAGDWQNRPGTEPWDPTYQAPLITPGTFEEPVWQAPHGGYPVQYDRLVFAGTYLRTFTRMTTMESANESARHAVNAILDHCVSRLPQHKALRGFWDSPAGGNFANPYDRGVFPTTPFGDYCRIWNPERNELPDFELLQRQDEQNLKEGKPHPWDAVGLELMPALMTQVYNSGTLLDELMKKVSSRGKDTPLAVHGVLAALRHLRELLEVRHPPQRK